MGRRHDNALDQSPPEACNCNMVAGSAPTIEVDAAVRFAGFRFDQVGMDKRGEVQDRSRFSGDV
jgi:hypothetical protein